MATYEMQNGHSGTALAMMKEGKFSIGREVGGRQNHDFDLRPAEKPLLPSPAPHQEGAVRVESALGETGAQNRATQTLNVKMAGKVGDLVDGTLIFDPQGVAEPAHSQDANT